MKGSQNLCLLLCFSFVFQGTKSNIDNEEQRFIDYLSNRDSQPAEVRHDEETDELVREKMAVTRQQEQQPDISKEDEKYHLIQLSAAAIVRRMSMPSHPNVDVLIDKAVHYVMKKIMVREYAQIRSGIKEVVEKMLHKNVHDGREEPRNPRIKSSKTRNGLREEKIVIAMEEVLQELAIRLNLTTPQIKKIVDISVKVLAKHLGLNPSKREQLHERVTSELRKMLEFEDEDNKDARLRRLEERIEKDIEEFKLTARQVKRIEELMVEEEAVEENLTKREKQRMLKRVYADVIDDLRTQKIEQEIGPPNLSDVRLKAINSLIRQKAMEQQLNKEELKVLGLAILTAVEHLSRDVTPTQEAQTKNPTTSKKPTTIPTPRKTKPPATIKTTAEITMTTTPVTKHNTMSTVTTESVETLLKDEEELEGDKPARRLTSHKDATSHAHKTQLKTSQRISTTHDPETEPKPSRRTTSTHAPDTERKSTQRTPTTHAHETHPKVSQPTPTTHARETEPIGVQRNNVKEETDLDTKLAQDEAELEGKDFVGKLNMDEETKAEELELELERKAQDKEESKTKTTKPTPKVTMPTKSQVTHSITSSTKVTHSKSKTTKHPVESVSTKEKHVTQGVTHSVAQETEKVTESEKPTTDDVTPTTNHVTLKATPVTQSKSELKKERLEEDLLEDRVPKPPKKQVTQPNSHATEALPPKSHVTDVTQPKTEHVTATKMNNDLAKELKSLIGEDQLHSRKNHELLQDEIEMDDVGLHTKKKKTLEQELNEILKTKNRELKQLEDELEDLKQ